MLKALSKGIDMNKDKGATEILDAIKNGFEFSDTDVRYHPPSEEWIGMNLKSRDYISHCQLIKLSEVCSKYNLTYYIVNKGIFFKKNILVLKENHSGQG